jgi:hypothetical protein
VTQQEAEDFYARQKQVNKRPDTPPSFGLNSTLVKEPDGTLREHVWKADGLYGNAIRHIVYWLRQAARVAENERQQKNEYNLFFHYVPLSFLLEIPFFPFPTGSSLRIYPIYSAYLPLIELFDNMSYH